MGDPYMSTVTQAKKTDMKRVVSSRTGLSQNKVAQVYDEVLIWINEQILDKKQVQLKGIGTIKTKIKKGRNAYNPYTKEFMDFPAKRVMVFRPSVVIKENLPELNDLEKELIAD